MEFESLAWAEPVIQRAHPTSSLATTSFLTTICDHLLLGSNCLYFLVGQFNEQLAHPPQKELFQLLLLSPSTCRRVLSTPVHRGPLHNSLPAADH